MHFLFFCGVIFFLAACVGLYKAPSLLRLHDVPKRADAIVILGGNPVRAFHAARLYHAGFAPLIYIDRPVLSPGDELIRDAGVSWMPEEDLTRKILVKQGIAENALRLYGPTKSTAEEALQLASLFSGKPCSLLVVTSPYHARRARMIFRDMLPESCPVTVVSTPDEPFPDAWWKSQDAARNVLLETAKILFYRLGGRYYATRI